MPIRIGTRKSLDTSRSAHQASQSGQWDLGLTEVETALTMVPKEGVAQSRELRQLRDRLSARVAEARLAEAETPRSAAEWIAAESTLQALRSLRERSNTDSALEPLQDRISEALSRFLTNQAEASLEVAASELTAEHPDAAIRHCQRALENTESVRSKAAEAIHARASAALEGVVSRFGVVIDPGPR